MRPHQHRGPRRDGEEPHQVRQRATRADRSAHGGWLRAGEETDRRRAVASGARPHQCGDGCRQRRTGFDSDGGDRGRRADALSRQASASGSQRARRCIAIRNLSAVREARVARRSAAPLSGDHRESLRARRKRAARAGAGRRADGHLFQGDRDRALRTALPQRQEPAQAFARRSDRGRDREQARDREAAGAVRRRRRDRCGCDGRASPIRRSSADSGRAHADGQRRAARRPSVRARHDRLLGHAIHQRAVQGRRLDPGARNAVLGSRLQLVGAGVHVQFPADEADPDRHRSGGDRPQLSGRDRRGSGLEARVVGFEPSGTRAGARRRSPSGAREPDRCGARGIHRRQPQARGE